MRSSYLISCITAVSLMAASWSCSSKPAETHDDGNVLVTVGDSALTVSAVVGRIPSGLIAEDSLNMFNQIVEEWVRGMVLADFAEKNITDIDRIDRMTEDYRNNLIIKEYLQSMSDKASNEIPEDKIRNYYDASAESMILEQPLVKGVLLKVAENDASLPDLRRWLNNFNEQSLDNIEKSGLRQALQYKYFNDEWVEWNTVADQIPYRFYDADAFLNSKKFFEIKDGTSVYLLRISDYIPTGNPIPYEFARIQISEILRSQAMGSYREKLISDIYERQINEGVLKPGLYDPVKKTMKIIN